MGQGDRGAGDVGVAGAGREDRGAGPGGRRAWCRPSGCSVSLGLKPSASQPPTWKRVGGAGALAEGRGDAEPVTGVGSQLVGLRVKSGRSTSTRTVAQVERDALRGSSGKGSETTVTWAVSGLTRRAVRTTTVPRSKGPATAGMMTAMESGAPL